MQTPTQEPRTPRRPRIAAAVSLLALASCVTLSACGGSSQPKTATNGTQAAATATATTAAGGATGAQAGGQTANGGTGQGGSTPAGSNSNGQDNGSNNGHSNNSGSSNSNTSSKYPAAFVAALHTFTGCVRSHGLNIPEPNLSGHGEIFNKNSVNPNSPNYRSALQACEADLIAILRAAGGSHIKGLGG